MRAKLTDEIKPRQHRAYIDSIVSTKKRIEIAQRLYDQRGERMLAINKEKAAYAIRQNALNMASIAHERAVSEWVRAEINIRISQPHVQRLGRAVLVAQFK